MVDLGEAPLCPWCEGNPVKRRSGRWNMYCSKVCANRAAGAALATRRRKSCLNCGELFSPTRPAQQSCSRACGSTIMARNWTRERYVAMARKGVASRELKREAAWEEQASAFATLGQAMRRGWDLGYKAGWLARKKGQSRKEVA